jgi:hypothetical protein
MPQNWGFKAVGYGLKANRRLASEYRVAASAAAAAYSLGWSGRQ